MNKEVVHIKSQGMTLIELLVSLLLSTIIASMMFYAFLFIKKCVMTQQALVRIQVNARTIDYLLGKALRNSGRFGCQQFKNLRISAKEGVSMMAYGLADNPGIKGINADDLPKAPGSRQRVLQRAVLPNDLLWLQSADPLKNRATIKPGTVIIASDCQQATLFRWDEKYVVPQSFALNRLSSTVFYVGKTKRINANHKPIYALYSTDFNGRTIELVEGVEQLSFSYGQLKNGELIYQRANEVDDWFAIVSIRLNALLNSVEDNDIKKGWSFEWPLMVNN